MTSSIPEPIPVRLEGYSATEMLLAWSTGEEFSVPYFELRFYCPCASCIDEKTGRRILERGSIRPEIRPLSATPIGRYAVQISWNDGHSTGMYHYHRLWELCEKQGRKLN